MYSFLILIFSFYLSLCTYRQEAFHFFDDFYFKDIINIYNKQLSSKKNSKKKCSMIDGPNCFFISENAFEPSVKNFTELKSFYEKSLDKYSSDRSKIRLLQKNLFYKLFLTFESYNLKVLSNNNDFYFPSEIMVKGKNSNFFKLYMKGKLLIKNRRENLYKNQDIESQRFKPREAFGITISDIEITLGEYFYFRYVYVRCHNGNNQFIIKGYDEDNNEVFELSDSIMCNNLWYKASLNELVEITTLTISKDIEIDNILIEKNMGEIAENLYNEYNKNKKQIDLQTKIIAKNLENLVKKLEENKKKLQEK